MKEMKKEYIEPAMRLAELRHKHHLLAGSNGQGQGKSGWTDLDETMDTYTGGDDTIIDEDDVI